MIIGIGTDMIEIDRVVKACQKEAFLMRYFTSNERQLIQSDKKKAADNFAVKEAVVKVFGTGFGKIEPIEVECLRDALGKPYVRLYGKAKAIGECMGLCKMHVSITNTKKYASAFAVGEALMD